MGDQIAIHNNWQIDSFSNENINLKAFLTVALLKYYYYYYYYSCPSFTVLYAKLWFWTSHLANCTPLWSEFSKNEMELLVLLLQKWRIVHFAIENVEELSIYA